MNIESHPLRITERDFLKEQSIEEWFNSFKGLDLHIRVLCARDLSPNARAGLPDPYCKIICGPAQHRTATQRRTLDPDWGEEFYLEWSEVAAGKRHVLVEVWDWDFWRPDELLGRGFIDINALAFEPQEVLELDLKLYPSNVRKLKDIKPPKKQQNSKKQQQNEKQQKPDGFQQPHQLQRQHSQLQRALSHTLLSQPSLRHYLQDTKSGTAAAAGQQQQQSNEDSSIVGSMSVSGGANTADLGTVHVALWWAPTWRHHAFDVAERVSFCLLPGEVKVPPVVTHAKLGTLYEEPCIVYIKLSLLEVQLGSSWYLEYLQQASKTSKAAARKLQRSVSSSTDWNDVGSLDTSYSMEEAVAAIVSAYHPSAGSETTGTPRSGLFEFLGGFRDNMSLAEEMRAQQQQQQILQQHLAAEPVFALARLRFGKNQCRESIPVRLRPGGAAVFREQFVFTTKRPLKHKTLVLEVVLKGKALPGGKMIARGEWNIVDLLMSSSPPPTTWLGVQAFRRNQLPGIMLPLQGIEGGVVELHAAAADADIRAAMYGVPAVSLAAATAIAGSSAAAVANGAAPNSPRTASGTTADLNRRITPGHGPAVAAAVAASSSSVPNSPRLSTHSVSRRVTLVGGDEGGSRRTSVNMAAVGTVALDESWAQWLYKKLPWPFNTADINSSSNAAATATWLAPVRRLRKPSPFATSPIASAIATGSSTPNGTPKAATAAAAVAITANGSAANNSSAVAAAAADICNSLYSPIPGLPVQPESRNLAGPLATLQLVVHRVELMNTPPKGWWLVLKVGPHWAKSVVRHDSDFAWQLSVPIYHPTTTLILVVYGDAGRGKVQFLGKLQYRISYLMYLNHREVIKSLKLRTTGSNNDQPQQQRNNGSSGGADSPHPPMVAPGVTASHTTGVVLLGFTCSIPDRQRLLNAYERSQYPPTVHHISLFHAVSRDTITTSHHQKVVSWLSSAADPPIPPVAAWKVLETGREKFKLSRSRHNIHRLRVATSWVPSAWNYFQDLKAWVRPTHNLMSVAVMAAVCFRPILTLFVFLLWRSVVALRRLLMHGLVEYLGFDLGELFDSAGILPSDLLYYDGVDEDDDAASTTSSGSGSSSIYGSSGAAASGGGGGWGGGGGVRDLAAVMMFQPRRLKMLKRRYEQLQRISLQVQNRIDDIAMVFERLQAMVTGQDPLATALFFWRMLLLAAALWLVGPGTLVFTWWCWEVLRPPSWRKPGGVKGPVQFVTNLPSKSLEDL